MYVPVETIYSLMNWQESLSGVTHQHQVVLSWDREDQCSTASPHIFYWTIFFWCVCTFSIKIRVHPVVRPGSSIRGGGPSPGRHRALGNQYSPGQSNSLAVILDNSEIPWMPCILPKDQGEAISMLFLRCLSFLLLSQLHLVSLNFYWISVESITWIAHLSSVSNLGNWANILTILCS